MELTKDDLKNIDMALTREIDFYKSEIGLKGENTFNSYTKEDKEEMRAIIKQDKLIIQKIRKKMEE